jgi:hypothetical protein
VIKLARCLTDLYTTARRKKKTTGLRELEDAMQASFKPNKNSNTKLDQIVMRGGKSQKEVTLSTAISSFPLRKGRRTVVSARKRFF